MFLVDGVEFELWCVAERESGLRARRHNKIQQPLNDAQMLAAWLLSIKGASNASNKAPYGAFSLCVS